MDEYKKILEILEEQFGWKSYNLLSSTGQKLVKDTLEARKLLKLKPKTRFQKFLFKHFFNN